MQCVVDSEDKDNRYGGLYGMLRPTPSNWAKLSDLTSSSYRLSATDVTAILTRHISPLDLHMGNTWGGDHPERRNSLPWVWVLDVKYLSSLNP